MRTFLPIGEQPISVQEAFENYVMNAQKECQDESEWYSFSEWAQLHIQEDTPLSLEIK
jgi:hypothetical protein